MFVVYLVKWTFGGEGLAVTGPGRPPDRPLHTAEEFSANSSSPSSASTSAPSTTSPSGQIATMDMRGVAQAIREGSEGYLATQYTAIGTAAIGVGIILFGLFASFLFFCSRLSLFLGSDCVLFSAIYLFRESPSEHVSKPVLAVLTAISFFIGAACSAAAGSVCLCADSFA
jgi:hypothetical protein